MVGTKGDFGVPENPKQRGERDYVSKNGFEHVVIGLSGGIDSALTASIATDALGPAHVTGAFMPSGITSRESGEDAAALAKNLKIDLLTVPIEAEIDAYRESLKRISPRRRRT